MAKLFSLTQHADAATVDGDTIEVLEGLLDAARQGRVRGLIYVAALSGGGDPAHDFVGELQLLPAIGAVDVLKEMLRAEYLLEDSDEAPDTKRTAARS